MATVSAMFTITDTGDLNGRNLLQRSFFTKDPWTGPTYNAVGDGFGIYHGKKCLPVTTRDLYENTNKGADSIFPDLTFEEGVQYTISGNWAQFRTNAKYNKMYLRMHHTDGTNATIFQPSQNNVWSSFTLTSTAGKTVDKITTTFSNPGVTYIADFKLEVGASATDWTPAPEDVNTALDDAKEAKELANTKNSVYYQATAPTGNLKDGDTWFDTDNDYKISRWKAGTQEWVAAELGDAAFANIDASKIIAGSVMGNIVLGGTIQAGGSDVGQDGKVLVKDVNDVKVASLSKDGLVATAGTIGGWSIDETSLTLSVPYTYDNSGDQVIAHGDGTDLIQAEDVQLVGNSEDDDANISLITLGRDLSDSIPYILCDDGTLDGTQVRIKNGKISCLKNDNTLTNGISTYIQSDSVVLSESITTDGVTEVNNVRLDTDRVQVLYTPDYEHRDSGIAKRAVLRYNDIAFRGDSANPQLASGIAHWSVLAARRTIKDELGVTIYHCGNLFWAHFDGKMTVGWASRMEEYISIVPNDDASFTNSKLCAPPERLEKYCLPQSPANPRAIYRVFPDGQLGLYHFIPPTNGTNNYEVLTYDNWEPCDIFWAHIG